jgi:hypothetical protein
MTAKADPTWVRVIIAEIPYRRRGPTLSGWELTIDIYN